MNHLLISVLFLVLMVMGALLKNAVLLIFSMVVSIVFLFIWFINRTKALSLLASSKTSVLQLYHRFFKGSEGQENGEHRVLFIFLGFVLGVSGTYLNYLFMLGGHWIYMTIAWIILFAIPYYCWNRVRNFAIGFLLGIFVPAFILGAMLLYTFLVTCSIEGC